MTDIALSNASVYATRHGLRLGERLGFGIHGTVLAAQHESKGDRSAIKAHYDSAPFGRERDVYERLSKARVSEILGFHVPQLIFADNELKIIEITIVTRPFVLDFAGSFLDARPEFSEEIWADWQAQKRDQFGKRWSVVEGVMDAFEEFGVYLVDISPSNIAFLE